MRSTAGAIVVGTGERNPCAIRTVGVMEDIGARGAGNPYRRSSTVKHQVKDDIMNTLRLQLLADELRQQNPDLYMPSWKTCAAGFACRMPVFNAAGLRADPAFSGVPCYLSDAGGLALMRFFDLDAEQAMRLFALKPVFFNITTGRRWARRIEREMRRAARDSSERRWKHWCRRARDAWNRHGARAVALEVAPSW